MYPAMNEQPRPAKATKPTTERAQHKAHASPCTHASNTQTSLCKDLIHRATHRVTVMNTMQRRSPQCQETDVYPGEQPCQGEGTKITTERARHKARRHQHARTYTNTNTHPHTYLTMAFQPETHTHTHTHTLAHTATRHAAPQD